MFWDQTSGLTEALLTLESIKKILWIDDVSYVLGQKKKEFQIYRVEHAIATLILSSLNPISTFTAINHTKLYYTQIISSSNEASKKALEEGYVYRWGQDSVINLINKQYDDYEFEEIWCFNILSQEKQFLVQLDFKNYVDNSILHPSLVEDMELSPDESKLAFSIWRLGRPEPGKTGHCIDIVVLEIPKNKTYYLHAENQITIKRSPCWINNNELVFTEENYAKKEFRLWLWNSLHGTTKECNVDIGSERPTSLLWNSEKSLLMVSSSTTLLSISLSQHTVEKIQIPESLLSKDSYQECTSFDHHFHFLASIVEDLTTPPQVVLYDLKREQLTNLTALNSDKENILLGKIEPLTITTKDGITAKGFLLYPVDHEPGKRYPLIIATYGFHGKRYALNVEEWHSSFPAQFFANEGYCVLLLNPPSDNSQGMVNDSEKARKQCGWQKLRVFEQAVTTLVNQGLVDENKVGLYGWSH
ncbi:MAG: alpha/beta hydrolase family protein [Chthoniobacterales bacterium]